MDANNANEKTLRHKVMQQHDLLLDFLVSLKLAKPIQSYAADPSAD